MYYTPLVFLVPHICTALSRAPQWPNFCTDGVGFVWLAFVAQAMSGVSDDHTRLNRQFLEERLRDQMEEVVLTERRT